MSCVRESRVQVVSTDFGPKFSYAHISAYLVYHPIAYKVIELRKRYCRNNGVAHVLVVAHHHHSRRSSFFGNKSFCFLCFYYLWFVAFTIHYKHFESYNFLWVLFVDFRITLLYSYDGVFGSPFVLQYDSIFIVDA